MTAITADEALTLLDDKTSFMELIRRADDIREATFGKEIETCSIVNAKSGNCPEDCKFCPQSTRSSSEIDKYPLKTSEELLEAAKRNGSGSFGIVTSGRAVNSEKERGVILEAVRRISAETSFPPCASLGLADEKFLNALRNAGLKRYHHNLEAAESFYTEICTTRSYKDNVETIKSAKLAGLKVCSGCLFGLGESNEQRVELLAALRDLEVDSVPINFLNPLDGTPIKGKPAPLRAIECLRIIAVARLMMPTVTIRVCGGRERNLRDMQSWIFAAGANGVMIGSYLTTTGRRIEDDMRMIADAGLSVKACR